MSLFQARARFKTSKFGSDQFSSKETRRILLRFMSLYLIYLAILAAVLFASLSVSGNLMEKKTIGSVSDTLSSGMEKLDLTITSYERAASAVMQSPAMHTVVYGVHDKTYSIFDAHRIFHNIVQTLEAEPTCGYIMKNGIIMIPSRYFLGSDQSFDKYMKCMEYPTYDAWMDYLSSVTGQFAPALTYQTDKQNTVPAILYLYRKGTDMERTELFYVVIPIQRLEEILLSAPQELKGNLTLTMDVGDDSYILYQREDYAPDVCSHTVSYTGSSGLTVSFDIAEAFMDEQMTETKTGFYLFTVIFLLIGLIFAIAMALYNSRPLAALFNAVSQYDTTGQFDAPTERITKEYKYILSILSNSSLALKSYEKELEHYAAETRYWSFVSILMGEETEYSLSLNHPPYTLLLIAPAGGKKESCSLLLSLIRQYIGTTISRSGFMCVFRSAVVILAEDAVSDTVAAGITEILDTIPDLRFRQIFVPNLMTSSAIRDAYAQATYMLTLPPPDNTLWQELKLASDPAEASHTNELLMQFGVSTVSNLLTSGQIETLTDMFDNCIAFFRSGGYADETAVRHIYTSCVLALSIIHGKFKDITADITIPDYASFPTVESLLLSLREALCIAHNRIRSSYEQSDITGNNPIIEFITANIGNSNLYSKLVMETFEISDKELQHHVKRCTGKSFFNYVEKTRMERARHLLLTTNRSVTEIGEACGYNSNSTFNRAFNRFYGMSPAEMRKRTER